MGDKKNINKKADRRKWAQCGFFNKLGVCGNNFNKRLNPWRAEEEPQWCLPARFYSSSSITPAALTPTLWVHIKNLSNTCGSMCVCLCVCLDVPVAQLVMSTVGGEGRGKRRKIILASWSHGSSLA